MKEMQKLQVQERLKGMANAFFFFFLPEACNYIKK